MSDEVVKLIESFKFIANKKWIKSVSKSFGSIGLTFEKELDKFPDAMYFPDYYGTEIKCTSRYSHYPLFLFTVAFDGPTFPEINRIVEKYGYYDTQYSDKKVIYEELNCRVSKISDVSTEDLLKYDNIIFGGFLHAGNIKGFKNIYNNREKTEYKYFS